jgi:predicted unusual protein kinase regulating ubiquinone biosynthesis (AarF/ABC1/UbiB family)
MAQVAAASSDFLPDEIASELAVFQEDVEPMTAAEVEQAFLECYGELPDKRYYGFDAERPIKSGSIASVYLAQKPLGEHRGNPLLVPVVVKVGRQNLEREFLIGKTVIKLAILSSQYWAPHSKLSPFLNSWLEQVDVFVEGFRRELDFEAEAENQMRFARRAAVTDGWHVPQVYHRSRRIIEMEFVDSAAGLNAAFPKRSGRKVRQARRRAGRKFLHAVISHLLVYREFHGDLHPGNVLLDADMRLFFIDWGNTVDVSTIWRPALRYMYAVLTGDAAAVASAVMELGVAPGARPAEDPAALAELERLVEETLAQSGLKRLGYDFALTLVREGHQGLVQRLELAINLVVALSRQGIVVRSDYLHLTRSLAAMLGSFLGLYSGMPRAALAQDVAQVLVQFPALEGLRQAAGYRRQLMRRVSRRGGQAATLPEGAAPIRQATTLMH